MSGPFKVTHTDPSCGARAGILKTPHGDVRTPVFMPVGTNATVKTLTAEELRGAGAQIILSNAYHLYLRPGADLIEEMGGLHGFMGWEGPILTDSGGYQVFSLSEKRRLTREGLEFKSHLDGSRHFLSPEDVIGIQDRLGSDILMPLDECAPYPADRKHVKSAMELTHDWLLRSRRAWQKVKRPSHLFGIIQGGFFEDLRHQSAEFVAGLDLPGIAVGGLSVGEPRDLMIEMLGVSLRGLPACRPRYLMGVGYPEDLVEAVALGTDMFDCVAPTRNGRNGTLFTSEGKLLIRNLEYARDRRPVDPECGCLACRRHSRAYLRHLFMAREILGLKLASLHNITFYIKLLERAREAIRRGKFAEFRKGFYATRQTARGKTAQTASGRD